MSNAPFEVSGLKPHTFENFASLLDPVAVCEATGTILYMNPVFIDWYNDSAEIGGSIFHLLGVQKDSPRSVVEREIRPASKRKRLRARFKLVDTPDHKYIIVHGHDISEVFEKESMLKSFTQVIESNNRILAHQKQEIHEILNNMSHGLFTVDNKLIVQSPTSAHCYALFGKNIEGNKLSEVLFTNPADQQIISSLKQLFEAQDHRTTAQNLSELDCRTHSNHKIFRVKFSPIFRGEQIYRILINVEDVTYLIKLEEKLLEEERTKLELIAAQTVQKALLPADFEIDGVNYVSFYEPAFHTGGDWFTYHHDTSRNILYLIMADVTGHGIPSALITGVICGCIKAAFQAIETFKVETTQSLEYLANVANRVIYETGQRTGRCMTMSFVAVELDKGIAYHINGGHCSIMIKSKNRARSIPNAGPRIGVMETLSLKEPKVFQLSPGDIVFLYSDGLIERGNMETVTSMHVYGKIRKLIEQHHEVETIRKKILETLDQISVQQPASAGLQDDACFIAIKWLGPNQLSLKSS